MRNSETRTTKTGSDDAGLLQLFNEPRMNGRKSCTFAVSLRMDALAIHSLNEEMNGVEAAELLRVKVARYEAESRGIWHLWFIS